MLLFKDKLLLKYSFLFIDGWVNKMLELETGVLFINVFKLLIK